MKKKYNRLGKTFENHISSKGGYIVFRLYKVISKSNNKKIF